MKRLLVVYNPRSSRAADVEREVLDKVRGLKGYMVGRYKIEWVGLEQNVENFARLLKDGDRVLSAGGDATAVIAANGILKSGKDVELAVLPYGNFNDLARTLGMREFADVFAEETVVRKLYPLEIVVDGRLLRYATCYVTIGMTAEAVKLYDTPEVRKSLKTWWGRMVGSYVVLARWYFKNRRKEFLPEFRLNGAKQPKKSSDYTAVNGRSMARVMKGGEDYLQPKRFQSGVRRLTSFWRLCGFMLRSMLKRVPGENTRGDVLEFVNPSTVELQAEGESVRLEGARKIEIRKAEKWLKVVEKER